MPPSRVSTATTFEEGPSRFMAFIPLTEDERSAMLRQVGVADVDELFADVPERFRFPKLDLVIGHLGEALPFWMFRLDYMHRGTVTSKPTASSTLSAARAVSG